MCHVDSLSWIEIPATINMLSKNTFQINIRIHKATNALGHIKKKDIVFVFKLLVIKSW